MAVVNLTVDGGYTNVHVLYGRSNDASACSIVVDNSASVRSSKSTNLQLFRCLYFIL